MWEEVPAKVALVFWFGLLMVALLYLDEVMRARHEGRALPPHRHPVLLLAPSARILPRLWPLVVIGVASALTSTVLSHLRQQQQFPGALPLPSLDALWLNLRHTLADVSFMFGFLFISGLGEGSPTGPLVLCIAAAAGVWCAIANPWRLGTRARVLAAVGAVGAVATVATMPPFRLLVPISEQPPALQFLRSVVSGIGVSFTSALVTALVWWVGIRQLFDRGRFARGAQTAFLASFVLGIVFLPLGLYSTALQNGVHEHGAWHFLVSPALTGLSEFVYLATMWVCWVAVSEGGSPVAALARGLALAWRRRLDFAVLIARVAVVLAPLRVFQLALSDVPVWGTWLLLSVLGSVVVLALLVATGLAYASLTDQFPSAIPQAGEEALPPNLPGDIPIAH